MAADGSTTGRAAALNSVLARPGRAARTGRFFLRRPLAAFSVGIVGILCVVAALAPAIATHDPITIYPAERLSGPSLDHFFGTDSLGRDTFSQAVYGARVSLLVGLLATALGTVAGMLLGTISAYVGGWVDTLLQQLSDAIMAIPAIIFLMLVGSVLGQGMFNVIWALALVFTPYVSRIVRGAVLSIREAPYVESARVAGAGPLRIMAVHILPNAMPLVIVTASVLVGSAMLAEGALSFLGLGIPSDDPTWKVSWGSMLSPDRLRHIEQAPWLTIYPGVALTLAVLGFNLLGDTLRDALDPRLRGT
ncbi:MAG: ABC transporter permease [Thermoflexaceae bacterium]|nr:ABC transporter permease [Thermoflexaceae bacterium]